MVLNSIDKLIEKYENGETSLKEEQKLRTYFIQEEVAPHLEAYRPLFVYFAQTSEETFDKEVKVPASRMTLVYRWMSVAAVAIIMIAGFAKFVNQPKTLDDLSNEELLAYNQTVEAFNLLTENFGKGTDNMAMINVMGESLDAGTENMAFINMVGESLDTGTANMSYLNEFSQAQNKIFKNQ